MNEIKSVWYICDKCKRDYKYPEDLECPVCNYMPGIGRSLPELTTQIVINELKAAYSGGRPLSDCQAMAMVFLALDAHEQNETYRQEQAELEAGTLHSIRRMKDEER